MASGSGAVYGFGWGDRSCERDRLSGESAVCDAWRLKAENVCVTVQGGHYWPMVGRSTEAAAPRLVLVCGLPGSGKTTTARRLVGEVGGLRLCPDEWRTALGVDLFDESVRARIEVLQWQLTQELLRLGQTVIIEWGLRTRAERDIVRCRTRELRATVELHYLDVPVDVLWERVSARNVERPPGAAVIDRHDLLSWAERFETPDLEEQSLYDSPAESS